MIENSIVKESGGPLIKNEPVRPLHRLFLWLNSGCNSRCVMCDIWKEKSGRWISVDYVRKWVLEWERLSIPKVILCGESLMHPDVWDIAKTIRAHGIRVELLSNGHLVEYYAQEVVDNCDVLRVSLDGPPEIHNRTRGIKSAFTKLRRGIQRVHSVRTDYIIDGRCAIHRMNFRYMRETVVTAKELSLNSISFSGTDVYNEEAFRRFGNINDAYVDSLIIRGDDLDELERELAALQEECAEDFRTGFISDTPEALDRLLLEYYRGLAGRTTLPKVRCNAPWASAVIDYDGTVRPCFPLSGYGNIHDYGTLDATVNSEHARSFREALNVETNPICQRCVCQSTIFA